MLIERVEKEGKVEALYDSSNIVASSYDKLTKDLSVTFKNGGNYTYKSVLDTDYFRFETAESQGKVLNANLKSYTTIKNENVDIEEIISKIKKAKEDELNSLLVGINEAMTVFTNSFNSIELNTQLMDNKLNKVYDMITLYKIMKNK